MNLFMPKLLPTMLLLAALSSCAPETTRQAPAEKPARAAGESTVTPEIAKHYNFNRMRPTGRHRSLPPPPEFPASAPEATVKPFKRWYKAYWGGIYIGDLLASLERDTESSLCRARVIMRSRSLAKWISGYESDTKGDIRCADGNYRPAYYETSFSYRSKGQRDIVMDYSRDGDRITDESNQPPENRLKRKAVPEEQKTGAPDPLTVSLRAREKIRTLFDEPGTFVLPFYDGRRRTDAEFTLHGRTEEGWLKASFFEKEVSGYTGNELKKLEQGANVITLYLDPRDLWPVRAEGRSPLGSATLLFEKECGTLDGCMDE